MTRLRHVRLDSPEAAPLVAGLAREYRERYGDVDVMADADATQFEPPHGAFVVLQVDGRTVAGAGLRRIDHATAELKRMWTSPQHRRQGLAARVVHELEVVAVVLGYRVVRLETGPSQPEAVGLYRSLGYRPVAVYGGYDEALAFERRLGPPAP